jgi:xylulokinase
VIAAALGIDVGTTNVKAAVVEGGRRPRVVARGAAPHPSAQPRPGWVEQSPEAWWRATVAAVRACGDALGRVRAVGVSGQGSTFAACDATGRPLGAAIGWQDLRATAEAAEIDRRLRPALDRAHGNRIGDAPEPKLLWLLRHRPAALEGAAAVLTAAAVVGARLGGAPVVNEGDAGAFLSWDRHRRAWAEEVTAPLGLLDLLPAVVAPGERIGAVGDRAAAETGVPEGALVVASTTDVGAAAVAAGAARANVAFYSKGTGGFLCCHVPSVGDPGELLALPLGIGGLVQLCAGTDTLGAAYDWCRALLGVRSHRRAERLARAAPPGAGGLVLLPWLQGAHHPILEPAATGVLAGLTVETDAGNLLRAVLEGTAIMLRWNLRAARRVTGLEFDRVVSSGGPTRCTLWNRVDAAAAEVPVVVAAGSDAAVGSALIAGAAVGLWDDPIEVGARLRRPRRFDPDPELVAAMRELDRRSRMVADALLPLFGRLARLAVGAVTGDGTPGDRYRRGSGVPPLQGARPGRAEGTEPVPRVSGFPTTSRERPD